MDAKVFMHCINVLRSKYSCNMIELVARPTQHGNRSAPLADMHCCVRVNGADATHHARLEQCGRCFNKMCINVHGQVAYRAI